MNKPCRKCGSTDRYENRACAPCARKRNKERGSTYYKDPQKEQARWVRSRLAKKAAWQKFLASVKAGACADCKGFFPACVMDFDHVRGEKLFSIGAGDKQARAAVLLEIEKCDLVCANCHRIRTWKPE